MTDTSQIGQIRKPGLSGLRQRNGRTRDRTHSSLLSATLARQPDLGTHLYQAENEKNLESIDPHQTAEMG